MTVTRGEGVQKSENFVDVIYGSPLTYFTILIKIVENNGNFINFTVQMLVDHGAVVLLLRSVLPPTREVRDEFRLDARDVRVEPLPEALGVDGEGEQVDEAHFAVPLYWSFTRA